MLELWRVLMHRRCKIFKEICELNEMFYGDTKAEEVAKGLILEKYGTEIAL